MAQALQIDTLAFSKRLREAGADEKLAEAIVEGITAADTSDLATKGDLAATEAAMTARIDKTEAAMKSDIAAVRTDLKWMMGIGAAILALVAFPLIRDALAAGSQIVQ